MRIKELETILVLMVALLLIYYFTGSRYFFWTAIVLGGIGLIVPALAAIINMAWMRLAEALGMVTSRIILTIVFYIFLFPISLLSKLFRKPSIINKRQSVTYFKERNITYTKDSMENMW